MVRQPNDAATRTRVAASLLACLTILLAGCTAGGGAPALDVQSGYLESLRGSNSLAHGTAEQPPKATLAGSAHAAALLRSRGETVAVDPSFWKGLVAPSGEDATWVGYYACLAGANKATVEEIVGKPTAAVLLTAQGGDELTHALSGNDALEQLTGRRLRQCLGAPSATGPIEVSEKNAIIIKARLKRAGLGGGTVPSDQEVEHVSALVREQGCNEWNQASSWAVAVLRPDTQDATLQQCRDFADIALQDPAGLYTSTELGMPEVQAQRIASSEDLRTWLTSDWTIRDPSRPSVGSGTLANTVLLVELTRLEGWNVPSWVADGVGEASRGRNRYDPTLAYLCQATRAQCEPAVEASAPSQREVAARVLDGSMTDSEGRLAALAALATSPVQEGLCVGHEADLYRKAPQTFAALASVDKTCWEAIAPSAAELTDRITAAMNQGDLDEAAALMLLSEAAHGKLVIREQMIARVNDAWASIVNTVSEQRGPDFLRRALPLNFVLFSETLKEWS